MTQSTAARETPARWWSAARATTAPAFAASLGVHAAALTLAAALIAVSSPTVPTPRAITATLAPPAPPVEAPPADTPQPGDTAQASGEEPREPTLEPAPEPAPATSPTPTSEPASQPAPSDPAPTATSPLPQVLNAGEARTDEERAGAVVVNEAARSVLRALTQCYDETGRRRDDCALIAPRRLSRDDADILLTEDVGSALGPEFAGMNALEVRVALGLQRFAYNTPTVGGRGVAIPVDDGLNPMWGGPILPPADKVRDPGFGD